MEYVFLLFLAWLVVSLPAIVYAAIIDSRRKRNARPFEEHIASLTRRFEGLEEQFKRALTRRAAPVAAAVAEKPAPTVPVVPVVPVVTPVAPAISVTEAAPATQTPTVREEPAVVKPAVDAPPRPTPLPPSPPVFPVRPGQVVAQLP